MMNPKTQSCMKIFVWMLATTSLCEAFTTPSTTTTRIHSSPIIRLQAHHHNDNNNNNNNNSNNSVSHIDSNHMELKETMKKSVASLSLASLIFMSSSTVLHVPTAQAYAYNEFDSDIDTVDITVQALKDAAGDAAASFKVFESINEIITEGKGVGGSLSASEYKYYYYYV